MGKMTVKGPTERALPARALAAELERIARLGIEELRDLWRSKSGECPPVALTKDLLARALCQRLQEMALGGLNAGLRKRLRGIAANRAAPARQLKVGAVIVREYQGWVHQVVVMPNGFLWNGQTYASLSVIAQKITGTHWNGRKFFGVDKGPDEGAASLLGSRATSTVARSFAQGDRAALGHAANGEVLTP